jgi:hypothetical protein
MQFERNVRPQSYNEYASECPHRMCCSRDCQMNGENVSQMQEHP